MDLYSALLGGQVRVPTPNGDVVLTIPAGTQPGQSFRLAGRGMPHLRDAQTSGDLLREGEGDLTAPAFTPTEGFI